MKTRRRSVLKFLCAASTVVFSTVAYSQAQPLSLSDYLHAAIEHNQILRSAVQQRGAARFASEAVKKGYYPQIGIGSHMIVAPGYDETVTNGGEFGAQISASYIIYNGGTSGYQIEKGGVGEQQGSLDEIRARGDVVYSVSASFVAAVKAKRELVVAKHGYGLLEDYLQLVGQLHASGQGSETDVLKTTVDRNNALIDINSRRISFSNMLLALAQVAGLPSTGVTDVDTGALAIPYDTVFHPEQCADLASQELVLRQAQLDAQIAAAKLRPTISLGADAGALTSLPNIKPGLANVFGASVGVSVSVPLLTFGALDDSYMAAEATAMGVSLQNEYMRSSIEHEFEITRNTIEQARSEIDALRANLSVAEQNFILAKARYAGGNGLSLDVLNAIQMLNQIRLAIEEAESQMEMAVLKLNRLNFSGADRE